MTADLATVERALRGAAPHALLDALATALAPCGVFDVRLLMADYGLTVLQPVTSLPRTAQPLAVHAGAPGRAFGAQLPYAEPLADPPPGRAEGTATLLHLPVSVRGDRLGVLSLALDADRLTEELREELAEVAEMLGHQIVVAERDTDLYLQARRKDRLTLAAEMQWQLLPARACSRAEYAIGAQLEPAYAIHGDNFDWSATGDRLTLTITNGMGEGIEASLLTNLAISALRNARRAGVDLADQAALADQAVYGQYRGRAYVSVLLLEFHLDTGAVEIVDAGSPELLRLRDGLVERIPFEAQLPLGLADDTPYVAQRIQVLAGDRLIFVSDGVHAVAGAADESRGERALARAIRASRMLPAAEVPRKVLSELARRQDQAPADDALVVCLDWFGRSAGAAGAEGGDGANGLPHRAPGMSD
ncbi:serine/threonine-protein phosphatase [Kitasatospora sp. NBC_01287]|uniref:PP2C family protein-serine/threonine phosphatase n=1 Tax=Kitasatospora sp. NBC_01287 TaxID=2903573 RepID=UPI0022558808|nr:PP2C family protein-serine/threonine phosphatase [Kitasatospora sp. NBC_01287]MCX4744624.1 serine/threonine-protein phosphatase [Kitasatospora sp. NBC_01287]